MKVLVVDDDDLNRSILQTILEDAEFETVMAEDGVDALAALRREPDIEVIMLDRMMPNMNGTEFMKHFNENPDWSNKVVIMQTAANQPKDVIEGNATGIYYYLTKPYDDKVVLSIVRSAAEEVAKKQGKSE